MSLNASAILHLSPLLWAGIHFHQMLQQQMQRTVSEQMVRPQMVTKARPSDVGLSEFPDAARQLATVIPPENYPRMLMWFKETDQLLRNSDLTMLEQI
jgi:hypothetical protein